MISISHWGLIAIPNPHPRLVGEHLRMINSPFGTIFRDLYGSLETTQL